MQTDLDKAIEYLPISWPTRNMDGRQSKRHGIKSDDTALCCQPFDAERLEFY